MCSIFCLPTEINVSPHQMVDLAITQLLRNPVKLNTLRMLTIIFLDKLGQLSAEILFVLDIILRQIRDSNIFVRGILVAVTLYHTQLQPVKGRLFLLSSHAISYFQMIKLSNSIRVCGDALFLRITYISRMYYQNF